jgi:hypothetical protein
MMKRERKSAAAVLRASCSISLFHERMISCAACCLIALSEVS